MLLTWTLPTDRLLDEWLKADGHQEPALALPAADVSDTGEEYRIVVDMPGVTKEGLEIEIKEDVLRVRGKRPATEKAAKMLADGRRADRVLERHFTLGQDIDRQNVRARLENGVLTVNLPRKAEEKPHRIEIEVG